MFKPVLFNSQVNKYDIDAIAYACICAAARVFLFAITGKSINNTRCIKRDARITQARNILYNVSGCSLCSNTVHHTEECLDS